MTLLLLFMNDHVCTALVFDFEALNRITLTYFVSTLMSSCSNTLYEDSDE